MDSLMSILWTGDPVESTFRLLILLMALEFVSVLGAYLGGNK